MPGKLIFTPKRRWKKKDPGLFKVLEAHVIAALPATCQHLIMIGDHQQLRPSTNNYHWTQRTHLDVSLFERLINSGIPHVALEEQHRMAPEISALVRRVFYSQLKDHSSVFSLK